MFPILFKVGNLEFRSYGIFLLSAFVSGTFFAIIRANKEGIDSKFILNLSIVLLISAFLGSRIFYTISNPELFKGHFWNVLLPFQRDGRWRLAGFSIAGGLPISLIVGILYTKLKGFSVLQIADVLAPPGAFVGFFARVGCFSAGCCFGVPTTLPFGIKFPRGSPAWNMFRDASLHPTQLYSYTHLLTRSPY